MCVFVCVFSSFRAFLGSFLALGAGRRAAPFSVGLFVCVFVGVFSSFRAFFGFLFGSGCWAAALLLFPSGFLCAFLFVFSLLFGLFWVPGDHGGGGGGAEAYDSGLGANYSGRRSL